MDLSQRLCPETLHRLRHFSIILITKVYVIIIQLESLNLIGINLISRLMIGSANASFDELLNTEYPVTENLEVPIVEMIEELIEDQNAPQFTVLNFHHFGEVEAYPAIENITTSPKRFRELLEALKKEGYTTITQEQVQNYLTNEEMIPEKSALIRSGTKRFRMHR